MGLPVWHNRFISTPYEISFVKNAELGLRVDNGEIFSSLVLLIGNQLNRPLFRKVWKFGQDYAAEPSRVSSIALLNMCLMTRSRTSSSCMKIFFISVSRPNDLIAPVKYACLNAL